MTRWLLFIFIIILNTSNSSAQCDTVNLLPNPSFEVRDTLWHESDPLYWTRGDGGELITDTDAKEGDLVWQFWSGQLLLLNNLTMFPNTTYQFNAWFKGDITNEIEFVEIGFLNRRIRPLLSVVDSVGNWKKLSCSFSSNIDENELNIWVYAGQIRMDDVSLYVCETTGVVAFESVNDFTIAPNPADSKVNIKGNNIVGKTIQVYSMLGKLVYSELITDKHVISLNEFTTGMYLLQIGNVTQKLIVK